MAPITLEQMHKELQDVKGELKRLHAVLEEDFELSDHAKKELAEARKESVSSYVDHKDVLDEFAE